MGRRTLAYLYSRNLYTAAFIIFMKDSHYDIRVIKIMFAKYNESIQRLKMCVWCAALLAIYPPP